MDYLNRAMTAYFRYHGTEAKPDMPDNSNSGEQESNGLHYVVLRNCGNEILAVYRIQNTGQLHRLKRWPKDLDEKGEN